MHYFKLPDLGEGLQEAEIVKWHICAGDPVKQDQVIASVETAKAIVDLPSPESGTVVKLFGTEGDIIHVGDPLLEYEMENSAGSESTSVVGQIEADNQVLSEMPLSGSVANNSFRVTPAVRALATRLEIDLTMVKPSGKNNTITAADVQRVANLVRQAGEIVPLKGARRTMALTMTQANSEVVPVTLSDDADICGWKKDEDISIRLIQALAAACVAEPALNAWYQPHSISRILPKNIDVGIALDTEKGLFVPVLRDVGERSKTDLRKGLEAIKSAVKNRSIPIEEMRGNTITLSNFGTVAGRYANPVVVPPTVAILGAGKIRPTPVLEKGKLKMHDHLPLSLTFDHRAVTGGEAARFLATVIDKLEQPS